MATRRMIPLSMVVVSLVALVGCSASAKINSDKWHVVMHNGKVCLPFAEDNIAHAPAGWYCYDGPPTPGWRP